MTGKDLAALFGEEFKEEKAVQLAEDDLQRIASRVKNKARMAAQGNLTPVGDILCNSFSHVLNRLHKFANGLPENDQLILKVLLRAAEEMPGEVVSAAKSQVVPPKGRRND